MSTQVTTRRHVLDVTAVQEVRVTEIVDDGGQSVRAIRIFGLPDGTEGQPVLEIILHSDEEENLFVTTPELTF